ncbi:MAG: EamA family transporter [Burkholderiaceae bacterium]|nr:EamA family transporter [Microbacteriaceae bacterium]
MLTVLFGIGGALIFGAADFIGGIASRRISALRVTAIGGASGLAILLLMLPLLGGTWSWPAVSLGILSGITGALAITLLYGCLAIGPMSILSPLTALVSALIPLVAEVTRGERLPPLGYGALGIAIVAVVLVGFVPDRNAVRPSGRALAMATSAGTLIGVFLIIIDLTPDDSGLVPLVLNRATNATLLFATLAVLALVGCARRRDGTTGPKRAVIKRADVAWRAGLTLAAIGGVVDATANVLLLLGLRTGDLSVMAVLTAMYPAGTIILAAIVLRERITPTQLVGLVLAIAAAALLALV